MLKAIKLTIFVLIVFFCSPALADEYTIEEKGAVCGDSILDTGEGCDDGNTTNTDGCNSSCQIESGYTCTGEPSICSVIPSIPSTPSGGGSSTGGDWGTTSGGTTTPITEESEDISEMTPEARQAKIAQLIALLDQLKAQIALLQGTSGIPADYVFTKRLYINVRSNDVLYLQKFLNSFPDTRLADSGYGSPGKETIRFGPLTKAAVIRFQQKYASDILTPLGYPKGTGIVAKMTNAKINQLLGR